MEAGEASEGEEESLRRLMFLRARTGLESAMQLMIVDMVSVSRSIGTKYEYEYGYEDESEYPTTGVRFWVEEDAARKMRCKMGCDQNRSDHGYIRLGQVV